MYDFVETLTGKELSVYDKSEIDALKRERDELLNLVKTAQFMEWCSGFYCPWCEQERNDGHKKNCPAAKYLDKPIEKAD